MPVFDGIKPVTRVDWTEHVTAGVTVVNGRIPPLAANLHNSGVCSPNKSGDKPTTSTTNTCFMSSTQRTTESADSARIRAAAQLHKWVVAALASDEAQWLDEALTKADVRRSLDIAFSRTGRKTGTGRLTVDIAAQATAASLIAGWQPEHWDLSDAVRILLAIAALEHDPTALDRLARHADIGEQCALYRGLVLYPADVDVSDLVGRGLRTHAQPVFESIAHYSPWPARELDQHRWNHLVLKAMFMDIALWPIQGFDDRRNADLARMALDFAAERYAAARALPLELFRCVAPFASLSEVIRYMPDVQADARGRWQDTVTTRALSLSLWDSTDRDLTEFIRAHSPHEAVIQSGELHWGALVAI